MANRDKPSPAPRQDMPEMPVAERFAAWQCIGCGRIEGAQPCIGVCQDRRAVFVHAAEYDRLLAAWSKVQADRAALRELLQQFAATTPREGAWAPGYRAFQARARVLLRATAGEANDAPA